MSGARLSSAVLNPLLVSEMLSHARREAPRECCGVLTLAGPAAVHTHGAPGAQAEPDRPGGPLPLQYHPARNQASSASRFEMDPDDLLAILDGPDADAARLWGLFHSHPRNEAAPSALDLANAFYPEAVYLILSLRPGADPGRGLRLEDAVLRGFSIRDGEAKEVALALAPPAGVTPGGAPPPLSTDSES
ncbi:MAG: Mov34/MPN/PAD-1 family protein [Bacillota bacterium]